MADVQIQQTPDAGSSGSGAEGGYQRAGRGVAAGAIVERGNGRRKRAASHFIADQKTVERNGATSRWGLVGGCGCPPAVGGCRPEQRGLSS
jgi:hypothetical protein